jgi:hypothetical protein
MAIKKTPISDSDMCQIGTVAHNRSFESWWGAAPATRKLSNALGMRYL